MHKILVIVSKIPKDVEFFEVYPPERQEQIEKCSNINVKTEKYFAWQTLRYSMEKYLDAPFESHNLCRNDNGKWISDKCYFSISHSQGVVAVAVSTQNVGVDIEAVKRHKVGLESKILTQNEMQYLSGLDPTAAEEYVIRKWSEKESIFKTLDQKGFAPTNIETANFSVNSQALDIDGERFILSISAADLENIDFERR